MPDLGDSFMIYLSNRLIINVALVETAGLNIAPTPQRMNTCVLFKTDDKQSSIYPTPTESRHEIRRYLNHFLSR